MNRFESQTFTPHRLIVAAALLALFALPVLGGAAAAAEGGCLKPFRCETDRDCAAGTCIDGLCAAGTRIHEATLVDDFEDLGLTTLRTTETTEGPTGGFRVEALKDGAALITFEWAYEIEGDVEEWTLRGSRVDAAGNLHVEELVFDDRGNRQGSILDPQFFDFVEWSVNRGGAAAPLWLGGGSFAAASEWALLSRDDCVSCDFPGCNCVAASFTWKTPTNP